MTDASPRFRSVLDTVPVYKPGRIPVSASGQTRKLSSNETPFAPLPSVVDAIAEAARSVHRYPDNGAQALIGAIADKFGVPTEYVAAGCGSVGVPQQLLAAIGEPGAEVMYAWRSFEAYPILADLTGAESVRVPLRHDTHDLDAMAAAISPRTRLIFVCNPNNPTGTVVHTAELEAFLDRVPAGCLVVLDEAYREYVRDEAVPDGRGPDDHAAVQREQHRAGRRDSLAGRRGRAVRAGGGHRQGADPGARGAGRRRLGGSPHRGQLRLARLGRAHPGLRRGLLRRGHRHPPVRR